MTSRATAIRDAVYDRAITVNSADWVLTRKTDVPSLAGSDLPALQVFLTSERMTPDGDDNVSVPRFISAPTIAISVVRGFDDPVVTDGKIDLDADGILAAILCDPTFIGMPPAGGGLVEAVTGITRRRLFPQQGETYFIELRLEITFKYRCYFEPVAPHWFEEIKVTAFPNTVTADGLTAEFEVGDIHFSVSGPSSGVHGTPSGTFTLTLEAGASFTGHQTITLSDGNGGGTFTPSVGSPGVGSVTVTPANNATSFTFTYTPASAGLKTLGFSDGQQWSDPTAFVYTAT